MRREECPDSGSVPDYVITQAALKKRLGITEKRVIRDISIRGTQITVDLGIYGGTRIRYHLGQEEFKSRLGIDSWHPVIMALASARVYMIRISLAGTHPEKSARIR